MPAEQLYAPCQGRIIDLPCLPLQSDTGLTQQSSSRRRHCRCRPPQFHLGGRGSGARGCSGCWPTRLFALADGRVRTPLAGQLNRFPAASLSLPFGGQRPAVQVLLDSWRRCDGSKVEARARAADCMQDLQAELQRVRELTCPASTCPASTCESSHAPGITLLLPIVRASCP